MSTCSELNVRILPPAHIAPGPADTNRQCTTLQSAAPPTRSGTRRSMPPMPALPPPASVSCHEKHATDTILRTLCTKTTSFAYFQSKNDREPTATASCYESPCQYPATRREKVFFKVRPIGPERAFRYPIDTLPIPGFREIRSRFASQLDALGPILDRFGPFLRTCATLPTRRPTPTSEFNPDFDPGFDTRRRYGPRRGPLLARQKPDASILANVESVAKNAPFNKGRIRSTYPASYGRR